MESRFHTSQAALDETALLEIHRGRFENALLLAIEEAGAFRSLESERAAERSMSEISRKLPTGRDASMDASEEPRSTPRDRSATEASASARRVLLVDDDPDGLEMMRILLGMDGHQVDVARDGAEALRKARAFRPDVVLCDIGLPGRLDGYGVARALRADSATRGARLIAITGSGRDEDRRRAHDAGFDRHLTKPADPEAVRQLLANPPSA